MRWAKFVGLAGVIGVLSVAGVQVYRQRRRREWHEVPPTELRDRLHERLAASQRATG
ncbi:MAG: hypothetical protein KUG57_01080 [Ilumatobacteraceae bacterium]|nr:hypothetical protein [Ilumatobacteraceae bacterium]